MTDTQAQIDKILAGPSGPEIAAFFDYDGTIIDGYSIEAFYRQRLRNMEVSPVEILQLLVAALQSDLDEDGFTDLAGKAAAAWKGRDEADLLEFGRRLLVQEIGSSLYLDAWEVVKAHRRMGHRVVLASAASRFQVEPMADELGADAVLCTQFETEDGMLTGKLDGLPLWGSRKAEAVVDYAADHDLDLADCYGYANGDEDINFLGTVGKPHAVNPQRRLADHAKANNWPVLTFKGRGRPDPLRMARTIGMFGMLAAGSTTGIALSILNRDRRQGVDLAYGLMGDLSLAMAGVDVNVTGTEHLWSHRPAVFIFNHQSGIDMPVLMKLIREKFTGVAKSELRNSPGFGLLFRWADVAFVDRGNTKQARAALEPVVDKLKEGISIVIAPEGTRSATPKLGPFKKGAFHLAMQAGVPIVPIVIRNAGEIAWRNSLIVKPGTIDVIVHPPISVEKWTVKQLDKRVDEVRQLYLDTLADWPVTTNAQGRA